MIDIHTHYVPHRVTEPSVPCSPWVRHDGPGRATIMLDEREFRSIGPECWDPDVRLAHMDEHGVDVQVVSPTPVFFCYAHDSAAGLDLARRCNDAAMEMCAGTDRLLPFCQVPLQDIDASCRELERCRADGHAGVEIGNHVNDRDLDDEGIVTFLQHAASLGVPVFVHPWDMPTSPRLDRWMAQWLTGMPAETHLSLLAMILGGVFDKVGDGLRICFAHGGGSFAFWLGRLDNAWRARPDVIATSQHEPSHYLGRFYVDSVVFDERPLRLLVDTLGADRVLLGSDYPYPLGERAVGSVVRSSALDESTRARILHDNAAVFLGTAS